MNIWTWLFVGLVVGFCIHRAKKLGYFDKKDNAAAGVVLDHVTGLAGTYGGRVQPPTDAEQKAAFAESRRRGETNFGGGTNGGFYLSGAYGFEADATGNIIKGEFILHGQRAKIVGGSVKPDGTFNGSHIGGPFEGRVTAGVVEGYVSEGGNRTWMLPPNQATRFIFGRMDGGFTAGAKL